MELERGEERGFTLLEVLIALAILGVSLGIVLTTVSDSLTRTRRGEQELIAASFAQSLLDRTGADLLPKGGETLGEAPGGFVWRLSTTAFGDEEARTAWGSNPVAVTATVSWQDAGQARSLTLQTLKLLPVEERR